MKLSTPFIKLPVRFDVEQLQQAVAAMPASAWVPHPNKIPGNSALRLITREGGENDDVVGQMAPTSHLLSSRYLQLVLASFGVVWSRSRLMQLAAGSTVPSHADVNYHWFHRVRLHIPIITSPEVRFHCDGQEVHMAAGEAWLFDNWRTHRVENPSQIDRVHLVADTTGTAAFWEMAERAAGNSSPRLVEFPEDARPSIVAERINSWRVMPPSEIDQLLYDLSDETVSISHGEIGEAEVRKFRIFIDGICKDWRQLWALFGDCDEGLPHYANLLGILEKETNRLAANLRISVNGAAVTQVVASRVLSFAINDRSPPVQAATRSKASSTASRFDRPVIIVAAPRSGSTALFETLAHTPQLKTVGGEAHWMIEGFEKLRPGAHGVESNRLKASHYDQSIGEQIRGEVLKRLQDHRGARNSDDGPVRFLEKTPKNALRIPFLNALFPDARFLFLHRDARENISSIMEAWRAGGWVTYPQLAGWEGDWSLLLPPGWRRLKGRPLAEVAAYQWAETNRVIMDDLSTLSSERHHVVSYGQFVTDPEATVRDICRFAEIDFDGDLTDRLSKPLPLSRHTLTPPKADKWRANADEIEPLLDGLAPLINRISNYH